LTSEAVVADIGSGTGFLTELFLENGNEVYAVEPNKAMRQAGQRYLQRFEKVTSIDGTAESITLADQSVDFIAVGQAFHWFDLDKARLEFQRILRPGGYVALVWNDRHTESTPFLRAYERLLLEHSIDYPKVDHKNIGPRELERFFGARPSESDFYYCQHFDFVSLRGRLLSSSYAPNEDDPRFPETERNLQDIFQEHQDNGVVAFEYDTRIFHGKLI
jgi:SAM-dependent methyltransferase